MVESVDKSMNMKFYRKLPIPKEIKEQLTNSAIISIPISKNTKEGGQILIYLQ